MNMNISILVVLGILHGCCSVNANCPICMQVRYKVTNVPPEYIQLMRQSVSFLEQMNTCSKNGIDTNVCRPGDMCSSEYSIFTAKGYTNVNPDIESTMEIVTRGCRHRPSEYETECGPLKDLKNPLLPGFDILFKMYDHFSMKVQICTSEQPHQFNLLIPESYVTTGSGKNSASCVSAIFEYTVLNGLFLILCLN